MYLSLFRNHLRLLPLFYMLFIWLQSSYFNPGSYEGMLSSISLPVLLILGITLEIGHLFEFAILYLLLIAALLTYGKLNATKEAVALMIAITYGFIDEIHQYHVPFRSFSIVDMVKNNIGIVVIWYIVHKAYYNKKYSKLGRFLRGITNLLNKGNNNLYL